ncbi:inactive protein tyrosine kinase pTKL [Pocillopora verrucosa]|uniref:inactive protein tyrosine kinase pTKL n=1 Tax=Pocillopora verrucosa TaxID=203993 RepID=UPI0027973800|nr:glycoprotein gp100-like [Pocillopora verrucosa]
MNTLRLLILAAFCVIFLILLVQGENENEVSEADMELQGHNLREKRSFRSWGRRSRRHYRPSYRRRYHYRYGYCARYWGKRKYSILKSVLKEVDCLNNTNCQKSQVKIFGEIFKPPTPAPPMSPIPSPSSSPVMTVSPSSSQVVSSMPAVSPSSSQVVSSMPAVSPSSSQVVSSMPAVSPTPSSSSVIASQSIWTINI